MPSGALDTASPISGLSWLAVVETTRSPFGDTETHAQPEPKTDIAAAETFFFIASREPNWDAILAASAGEAADSLAAALPGGASVLKYSAARCGVGWVVVGGWCG